MTAKPFEKIQDIVDLMAQPSLLGTIEDGTLYHCLTQDEFQRLVATAEQMELVKKGGGFPVMLCECENKHTWKQLITSWFAEIDSMKCPQCNKNVKEIKWYGLSDTIFSPPTEDK